MTSDAIQNKETSLNHLAGQDLSKGLELTRDQSFLDGTHDIFDVLARKGGNDLHPLTKNKEALQQTIGFLDRARAMLGAAEQKIKTQAEDIQSLKKLAQIDSVTGLMNTEGFSAALKREIARTNRGLSEGGLLVLFNLENLDAIEKNNGDKAARTALRLVARALESEIRDMDLAARIDEDEFVLLFSDTTMEKALNRLQNMALRLNRLSLIWDGAEIRVSLSLGLKSYEAGDQPDKVFRQASMDLKRNRKGVA
ncbi:MAG: GGDEF domain-containing protein [Alphaproteobacteria bacterium]|nr:GGDEF domain-containing protein [Alphaproteobacteria bacterium]